MPGLADASRRYITRHALAADLSEIGYHGGLAAARSRALKTERGACQPHTGAGRGVKRCGLHRYAVRNLKTGRLSFEHIVLAINLDKIAFLERYLAAVGTVHTRFAALDVYAMGRMLAADDDNRVRFSRQGESHKLRAAGNAGGKAEMLQYLGSLQLFAGKSLGLRKLYAGRAVERGQTRPKGQPDRPQSAADTLVYLLYQVHQKFLCGLKPPSSGGKE